MPAKASGIVCTSPARGVARNQSRSAHPEKGRKGGKMQYSRTGKSSVKCRNTGLKSYMWSSTGSQKSFFRSILDRAITVLPGMVMIGCLIVSMEMRDCLNPMNLVDYPIGSGYLPAGMLGPVFDYLNLEYAGKALCLLVRSDLNRFDEEREAFLAGKLRYETVSAFYGGHYLAGILMLGWKVAKALKNRAIRMV